MRCALVAAAFVCAAIEVAGCRGRERTVSSATQTTAAPPPSVDTVARPSAANVIPYDTAGEPVESERAITPAMVRAGLRIYRVNCAFCHGRDAEGSKAAPRLRNADWIDADGSYGSIIRVVINGVPHPRAFPSPMLPYGGERMTLNEVRAVAAYVYSLQPSHRTSPVGTGS